MYFEIVVFKLEKLVLSSQGEKYNELLGGEFVFNPLRVFISTS